MGEVANCWTDGSVREGRRTVECEVDVSEGLWRVESGVRSD